MLSLWIPLGIALLIGVGFISVRSELAELVRQSAFADEFLKKFWQYWNSRGEDAEAYAWLTYNSVRMQRQLGNLGIIATYKPPGVQYAFKNYQVVVNMIGELNSWLTDRYATVFLGPSQQIAQALNDVLVRHLGVLGDRSDRSATELRNPFVLLRKGVQQVIVLPVRLLNWLGLLGGSTVSAIRQSAVIRLLGGVITLLGLTSAVVTLVVGWDLFMAIVRRWLDI